MTELESLVALNILTEIGSRKISSLLEYFDKPQNIFGAGEKELIAAGLSPENARAIKSFDFKRIDLEFSLARKAGISFIALGKEGYPENLKEIPGAPIVLYVKGSLLPADKKAIAVVGSRKASFYGLSNAAEFGFKLASLGFTVISGLARGVDTQSHKGALRSGGRTIAVIGSGLNELYPAENKELAEEISRNGCVISEFPLHARPLACNFPRRNRLISGLSQGVLVVEAAQNSGALITAGFALEQGREVFAIPGKIDSPNSSGTNGLIKDGAKMVTALDDILEEFPPALVCAIPDTAQESGVGEDIPLEQKLQSLITDRAIELDELMERTNANLTSVYHALFNLLAQGRVKQLAGKQFVRHS